MALRIYQYLMIIGLLFVIVKLFEGSFPALVSTQLATVVSGVGWTHKGGDEDDPWLSLYY